MSSTTFRAVFEAEDKSFSSVMRRMRDESNAMAEGMLSDANKISQASGQKVNKVLEEQIALYEKRSRLMRSQEAMELTYRRDQALSAGRALRG
ncbi:hypothetical protein EOM86_09510, partial [Candidatus Nomurabacteria bacterium]|nr:hypothetical protein [Candidatus Nomurabacteria bacterium]